MTAFAGTRVLCVYVWGVGRGVKERWPFIEETTEAHRKYMVSLLLVRAGVHCELCTSEKYGHTVSNWCGLGYNVNLAHMALPRSFHREPWWGWLILCWVLPLSFPNCKRFSEWLDIYIYMVSSFENIALSRFIFLFSLLSQLLHPNCNFPSLLSS